MTDRSSAWDADEGTVRADVAFSIIPEWVLDSGVSARALHAYAVLGRYADREGHGFPGRKTAAARMRCSVDTFDRAVVELVDIGAVEVTERRRSDGSLTSNDYLVRRVDLRRGSRTGAARGGRMGAQTINENHKEREKELAPSASDSLFLAGFDEWWSTYPRRVDKARGREKYLARRRAGASADDLLAAAEQYRRERDGEPAEFTKHPATFLARDDGPWAEALERARTGEPPGEVTETERITAEQQRMNEAYWARYGRPE